MNLHSSTLLLKSIRHIEFSFTIFRFCRLKRYIIMALLFFHHSFTIFLYVSPLNSFAFICLWFLCFILCNKRIEHRCTIFSLLSSYAFNILVSRVCMNRVSILLCIFFFLIFNRLWLLLLQASLHWVKQFQRTSKLTLNYMLVHKRNV